MGMPRLEPRRCQHRGAWFPLCPVPRTVPKRSRSAPAPSRVPRTRSTARLRIHPWAKDSAGWTGRICQPGCSGGGTGVGQWQSQLVDGRAGPLGTGTVRM